MTTTRNLPGESLAILIPVFLGLALVLVILTGAVRGPQQPEPLTPEISTTCTELYGEEVVCR